MVSALIRNAIALMGWAAFLLFSAYVGYLAVNSNYMGILTAFELMGYETKPIGEDTLVGRLYAALAPEATQAQFYAQFVSCLIFGVGFLCTHFVSEAYDGYRARREYVRAKDEQRTALATNLVTDNLIRFIVLAIPVTYVIGWDVDLFRYRSLAAVFDLHDPASTPSTLPHWDHLPADAQNLAAARVAVGSGATGYLAATLLACMMLEMAFHKLGQTLNLVFAPLDDFLSPSPDTHLQLYGYDAAGYPVYDLRTPISYDVNQQPVGDTASSTSVGQSTFDATDVGSALGNTAEQRSGAETDAEDATATSEEQVQVMGGRDERVSLAEAQANPEEYHVDRATRTVWNKAYWDSLHASEELSERDVSPKRHT